MSAKLSDKIKLFRTETGHGKQTAIQYWGKLSDANAFVKSFNSVMKQHKQNWRAYSGHNPAHISVKTLIGKFKACQTAYLDGPVYYALRKP
ncbi:MAG: hypothetical protein DWQ49_09445 [Bacteroidetes bacterium]|nr:MAG: hypothetical protein DWQ49_09445 [Bacteroidota bacterium]